MFMESSCQALGSVKLLKFIPTSQYSGSFENFGYHFRANNKLNSDLTSNLEYLQLEMQRFVSLSTFDVELARSFGLSFIQCLQSSLKLGPNFHI